MPTTLHRLRRIGRRANVIQIVPTLRYVRTGESRHERAGVQLVADPLASPTGPGGAPGFRDRNGSTIQQPKVTNVYMGPFWGDRPFIEGFSKAIVENGYLDPLRELNYGTGSGSYAGAIDGPVLAAGSTFTDADAQAAVQKLLASGAIQGDANSLVMLILPDKVTSELDAQDQSCSSYCGYHDAFSNQGVEIAYGVLPSALCKGCGGQLADFTAVYAHELAEACTDKVPGQGWVADDGEENGDLEAWTLLNWGPPDNPNLYTIQGYYTNERGNTVGAWRAT